MTIFRFYLENVSSTQDYAKQILEKLEINNWLLVTADKQLYGRGTNNRSWFSPPDVNLYATFVVPFPKSRSNLLFNIPQVVAYSVAQTLNNLGFQSKVKWINDVLINRKKVSGILCETASICHISSHSAVIIGIGINVNMTQADCESLERPTTSLLQENSGHVEIDKEILLALLQKLLEKNIIDLMEKGFEYFLLEITKLLEFVGEEIKILQDHKIKKGIMRGINSKGMLLLETSNGMEELISGHFLW